MCALNLKTYVAPENYYPLSLSKKKSQINQLGLGPLYAKITIQGQKPFGSVPKLWFLLKSLKYFTLISICHKILS